MNTQAASSTIKLNLPSGILQNAQQEGSRIGISLQDFIRMLMGSYFANSTATISKNSALLTQAKKEIAAGDYTVINTAGELNTYLKTLDN